MDTLSTLQFVVKFNLKIQVASIHEWKHHTYAFHNLLNYYIPTTCSLLHGVLLSQVVWLVTCVASILLGLDLGLGVGLGVELLTVVFRTQLWVCTVHYGCSTDPEVTNRSLILLFQHSCWFTVISHYYKTCCYLRVRALTRHFNILCL